MNFGGHPFAESTLAGTLLEVEEVVAPGSEPPIGGPAEVPLVIDPFTVEVAGVSLKPLIDTLNIDIELGRQGTASFVLVNVPEIPIIGEPVRVLFYGEVLFVGAIDRVKVSSNNTQTYRTYACECTDNSYLLFRKKIKRSFTNVSISNIVDSLLAVELGGDGITLGTLDHFPVIPSVDADNVSVFDMLNDVAVSVGALFYIDNDKRLNFLSATIETAPTIIDENIVEECSITFDRETYRNKQTVYVTGTPVTQGEDPITIEYTTTNNEQYLQRASIEGNSGLYTDITSITHPTSNVTQTLFKLGVAFAKILLAVRGALRETLSVRTRQYGFRAGQLAEVSIPHLSRSGNYVIQHISMSDLSGRYLISNLDLSPSTLKRRAQELWLDLVVKGKTVVIPPTAITTQSQTFSTPGSFTFTVPPGIVLVQVTCKGSGGGGGGGAYHTYPGFVPHYARGGSGGAGGLAITAFDVTPGDVLLITVPAGGARGNNATINGVLAAAQGSAGGHGASAKVGRNATFTVCEAYGGRGGLGGRAYAPTHTEFSPPQSEAGSGIAQAVTAGGGATFGIGGRGVPLVNGTAGGNGSVIVEW